MVNITNDMGNISITSEVFMNLAGDAATSCFGVKGMAGRSKEGGPLQLLRRESMSKGVDVSFNDDGSIFIASSDIEACRAARKTIEDIVFEPEVGALYYGEVKRIISNLGAFVELAPGKDAMCHIKDLEFKRTEKVEDVLNVGDKTWVKFTGIDEKGRWNISRKDALRERGEA